MSVLVLRDQAHDAAVEVAQVVRQVGVITLLETFPAKVTVAGERALAHEVIAKRFGAELGNNLHRLDDIAERFTHLLALEINEAVTEDPARRLQAGGYEHGWPQGAMEAGDVLTDHVQVGGPPFVEKRLVGPIADARDVVEQGVE